MLDLGPISSNTPGLVHPQELPPLPRSAVLLPSPSLCAGLRTPALPNTGSGTERTAHVRAPASDGSANALYDGFTAFVG